MTLKIDAKALFINWTRPFLTLAYNIGDAVISGFSCFFQRKVFRTPFITGLVSMALVSSSCGMETTQYSNLQPEAGHVYAEKSYNSGELKRLITQSPDYLSYAAASNVQDIFRVPRLVREDSPVTIWHYASENCAMDLYFHDSAPADAGVQYYEFRNKQGQQLKLQDQRACIDSILKNRDVARQDIRQASL